jgi:glyoxylase-like metal-dependent hydrolase (beta-lactamase superfamily II)
MIRAMKRIIFLAALLAAGVLSLGVAAFQQPPAGAAAPKVVEVEKLRDNLFMLKGGGGNTAVFIRSDGITVVDTKNPGWGQPILDKIKELSQKPITTIINTHTHGDHVSGNVEFPTTVEIIVQENTKANMQEMRGATGIAQTGPPTNIFKVNNGRGMPTRTFKDKMTVGKGADEIDLFYFGRGHTNGDAWVVFPALRLVHAGDIFSGKNLPLLDANNGGSGVQIGDTLSKAARSLKNIDTIITGHSTTMTMADLAEYAAFNKEFMADVQAAKKAGKSVDDVAASWKMPAKYKGYAAPTGAAAARLKANVQIVFDETK